MLIDDILEHGGVKTDAWSESAVKNTLKSSFVIKAQNVADYLYQDSPSEIWDISRDFPNVAPSMPFIWVEWKLTEAFRSKAKFEDLDCAGLPFGALVCSRDLKNDPEFDKEELLVAPGEPVRWVCMGLMFSKGPRNKPLWVGSLNWMVTEEGRLALRAKEPLATYNPAITPTGADEKTSGSVLRNMFYVPYLTLTFLHCKNVDVATGENWPEKLQKAREKRGKLPLFRWHTLVIEPAKKIIASANNGDKKLTPKALHICRGHFKDFSDKGLFGKYRRMYWWPMHARGAAEHGIVGKDYLVKPKSEIPESASQTTRQGKNTNDSWA